MSICIEYVFVIWCSNTLCFLLSTTRTLLWGHFGLCPVLLHKKKWCNKLQFSLFSISKYFFLRGMDFWSNFVNKQRVCFAPVQWLDILIEFIHDISYGIYFLILYCSAKFSGLKSDLKWLQRHDILKSSEYPWKFIFLSDKKNVGLPRRKACQILFFFAI